jgi:hypothetical protein
MVTPRSPAARLSGGNIFFMHQNSTDSREHRNSTSVYVVPEEPTIHEEEEEDRSSSSFAYDGDSFESDVGSDADESSSASVRSLPGSSRRAGAFVSNDCASSSGVELPERQVSSPVGPEISCDDFKFIDEDEADDGCGNGNGDLIQRRRSPRDDIRIADTSSPAKGVNAFKVCTT